MKYLISIWVVLLGYVGFGTADSTLDRNNLGHGRAGDLLFVHHPPDPVNTRTGNFFLPLQDYYLSCFNYPLEVYRSYNSFSTKNGPFGHGWTFNYDIQIIVGQASGLKVVEADGFVNEYLPVENKYQSQKEIVDVIIQKRKAEDIKTLKNKSGKGAAFYDKLKERLFNQPDYYESLKNKYVKISRISPSGKYISKNRGTSTLTQSSKGFVRENEVGQKETYNAKGLLTKVEDRNNNSLRFTYDNLSRLSTTSDACGNALKISYNKNDKIVSIKDSFQRVLNYAYDAQLRLTSFTGLDKKTMTYAYDKLNRMTKLTFADGTSTTFGYQKDGRVSNQIGPGTKHASFEYGKDGGTFWTKVTENKKETSQYRYTDHENKIVHSDPQGVTTTTVLSTCCGKPISIKSSNGINDVFLYDQDNNLQSRTNAAGEVTEFIYEPRFKSISDIKQNNGKSLRYRYDTKGNLVFAQSTQSTSKGLPGQKPIRQHLKIAYESHGKIRHMVDHLGTEIYFSYSPLGKVSLIEKKKAKQSKAKIEFSFDKVGQNTAVKLTPNQPNTSQEIQATLKNFMVLLEPTGIDFEI